MESSSRLVQPPSAPSEEGDSNDTALGTEPVVAVQLVCRTSHPSLSALGQDMEVLPSAASNPSCPCIETPCPRLITSTPLDNDAQPYLRGIDGGPGVTLGPAPWTVVAAEPPMSGEDNGAIAMSVPSYAGCLGMETAMATEMGDDLPRQAAAVIESRRDTVTNLLDLPNEVLHQILSYLDICDLLATSRVSLRPPPPIHVQMHVTPSIS